MHRKVQLIQQWLEVNNVVIKNDRNYNNDPNINEVINRKIDVMLNVLMGQKIKNTANFEGIENLIGDNNPMVNFIRNCSYEELYYELTSISDEKGIKQNLSILNPEKIVDLYQEKKAKGEIQVESNREVNNTVNQNINSRAYDVNQTNFNSYTSNRFSNYQNNYPNSNFNSYGNNNNYRDLVDACGNSIDCVINGIRVIIIPNEKGEYTIKNQELYNQSMELRFNGGESTQTVNKKTLTREEFNSFIENYKEDILGLSRQKEKQYVKETSYQRENNFELDRELREYNPSM